MIHVAINKKAPHRWAVSQIPLLLMRSKGEYPLPLCVTGWISGIIGEDNTSTVRDDPFDTGREALDTMMYVIERDSIRSFLEGESEEMH